MTYHNPLGSFWALFFFSPEKYGIWGKKKQGKIFFQSLQFWTTLVLFDSFQSKMTKKDTKNGSLPKNVLKNHTFTAFLLTFEQNWCFGCKLRA